MKKILCSFIIFLELFVSSCSTQTPIPMPQSPSSTPTPTLSSTDSPSETAVPQTQAVLEGCARQFSLRIRSAPGTQTDVLGGISSGKCVSVFGRNQDSSWAKIKAGDIVGWVSAENLIIVGEISQLPVVSENGENDISQNVLPTATKSPVKTKTPIPAQNNTSTPRPIPTAQALFCKDTYNMAGSTVKCKIPRAFCSYQSSTSGSPTFCNDAPYPNHNFILVVWGSDWSDLDGSCINISGNVTLYKGKPQIEATNRSQVTNCD